MYEKGIDWAGLGSDCTGWRWRWTW